MIGTTVSHYRVLEKLGESERSFVYRAEDTRLGRHVTLKFPARAEDDPSGLRQEAKAASTLDHRNICAVYEIDETIEGRPFIVMAYYRGRSLRERLQEGRLDVGAAVSLALQCAEGLSAAHEQGVIHRGVKPDNLLLTEDGEIRILDFGLAGQPGDATGNNVPPARPTAYMSPEQVRGEPIDQRTDVWSLGVVLYEMLTGSPPFHVVHEPELVESIVAEQPVPVREARQNVPQALSDLVERMLRKDPDERPQDADEIVSELLELRRTLIAPTPSPRTPATRTGSGRAGWGLAAVALILIATLIGLRSDEAAVQSPQAYRSLAVLPLAALSAGSETELFAQGLTEELISRFAQHRSMRVVSRTSVAPYARSDKGAARIADELEVDVLIEGGVRLDGDQLRVNLQLVDPASGRNLWAEVYDRRSENALDAQTTIALGALEELGPILIPPAQAH